MPLVRRFGISPMPVSREFAREWQFNGLPTNRPSGFPDTGAFSRSNPTNLCRDRVQVL
jgi:hypothetical protein